MPINPQNPGAISPEDVFKSQRQGCVFHKEGHLNDATFTGSPVGIFESWKYSFDAGKQIFKATATNKIYEKRLVKDNYGNPKWTGWMEIPDAENFGVLAIAVNDGPLQLPNTDGALKIQITPALIDCYNRREVYDLIDEKVQLSLDSQYEYIAWPLDHGVPMDFPQKNPEALGPLEDAYPSGGIVNKVYIVAPKPRYQNNAQQNPSEIPDDEDYFIWALTDSSNPNSYGWVNISTPGGQSGFVTYPAFNDHKGDPDIHLRIKGTTNSSTGKFTPDKNADGTLRTERDDWNDEIQNLHDKDAAIDVELLDHKQDDTRHITAINDPDNPAAPPLSIDERQLWNRTHTDFRNHESDFVANGIEQSHFAGHTVEYSPHFQQKMDNMGNVLFDERDNWNKNIANLDNHVADETRHINSAERSKWNLGSTLPTGDKLYDIFNGRYHSSFNQYKLDVEKTTNLAFETPVVFNDIRLSDWNVLTTYSRGDKVRFTSTTLPPVSGIYVSLIDNNTGNEPLQGAQAVNDIMWKETTEVHNPMHEFTQYAFTPAATGEINFETFFKAHADDVISSIELKFDSYNTNGNDIQFQVGLKKDHLDGTLGEILAVSERYNSASSTNPPQFWDIYNASYVTRGLWDSTITYNVGDLVFFNDIKFVCITNITGNPPIKPQGDPNAGLVDPNWKQILSIGVAYFDTLVVKATGPRPLNGMAINDVKVIIKFKKIKGIEIGDHDDENIPAQLPINFIGPRDSQPTYNGEAFKAASEWGTILGAIENQNDIVKYIGAMADTKVSRGDVTKRIRYNVFQKTLLPSLVTEQFTGDQIEYPVTAPTTANYDIPSYMPIFRDILSKITEDVTSRGNTPTSVSVRATLVANSGITNSVKFQAITTPNNDPNNWRTPIANIPGTTDWNSLTNYVKGMRVIYGANPDGTVDTTANAYDPLNPRVHEALYGPYECVTANGNCVNKPPVLSNGTIDGSNWKRSTISLAALLRANTWNKDIQYLVHDRVKYQSASDDSPIYYQALQPSKGVAPIDGPIWELVVEGWNKDKYYPLNAKVSYKGIIFTSLIADNHNFMPILENGNQDSVHWQQAETFADYMVISESQPTDERGPLEWNIDPYEPFDQIIIVGVGSIANMQIFVNANLSGDITAGRYEPDDPAGNQQRKSFTIIGYNKDPDTDPINALPAQGINVKSYKVDIGHDLVDDPVRDADEPLVHEIKIGHSDVYYHRKKISATDSLGFKTPLKEVDDQGVEKANDYFEEITVYGQEIDDRYASTDEFDKTAADLNDRIDQEIEDRTNEDIRVTQETDTKFATLKGTSWTDTDLSSMQARLENERATDIQLMEDEDDRVTSETDAKFAALKGASWTDADLSSMQARLASERATDQAATAAAILAEETRATTAENALDTRLVAEVARASGAEANLTTDLAAEVLRASTAETAESTRAQQAEAAETLRAETAEQAEKARAMAEESSIRSDFATSDTQLKASILGGADTEHDTLGKIQNIILTKIFGAPVPTMTMRDLEDEVKAISFDDFMPTPANLGLNYGEHISIQWSNNIPVDPNDPSQGVQDGWDWTKSESLFYLKGETYSTTQVDTKVAADISAAKSDLRATSTNSIDTTNIATAADAVFAKAAAIENNLATNYKGSNATTDEITAAVLAARGSTSETVASLKTLIDGLNITIGGLANKIATLESNASTMASIDFSSLPSAPNDGDRVTLTWNNTTTTWEFQP